MLKNILLTTLYTQKNICTTCPVSHGVLHFHVLHFHFLQLGPSFTRPAISKLPVKRVIISLTDVYTTRHEELPEKRSHVALLSRYCR